MTQESGSGGFGERPEGVALAEAAQAIGALSLEIAEIMPRRKQGYHFFGVYPPHSYQGEYAHSIELRNDEYPGRGVIMPVARATMLLSCDGSRWAYFGRSETSHSANGTSWSESATIDEDGVITARSDYHYGYSSRPTPPAVEVVSSSEVGSRILLRSLGSLTASLMRYKEDLVTSLSLKREDFPTFEAFDKAREAASIVKYFRSPVLGLETEQYKNAYARYQ